MRPLALLPLLALAWAGPVLRLRGEVEGPLVLTTPGLWVEGEGAVLRGREGHTLVLKAPGIRVRGLRVEGAGPNGDFFEPDAGVYLEGCEGCLLEDLEVQNAPTAVLVQDSPGVQVLGLKAQGQGEAPGVLVYQSPMARVEGSHLQGFADGVYLEYSPDSQILNNRLEANARYGVHVMFSWRVLVRGNRSLGNGVGSAVMHGAENRVEENLFAGSRTPVGYGLLVQDERKTLVQGNRFEGNTLGLVLMDAQSVRVEGNEFRANGFALRVTRERGGNTARVLGNAFKGNLYDLLVDDPQAKTEVKGNAYDRAPGLPVPHLPSSSLALALAWLPELSLFALSPGVVFLEALEAHLPEARLLKVVDPNPLPLPREGEGAVWPLILGLLGGVLWWWRKG